MNPSQLFANVKAFFARYTLQQKLGMVFAAGLVVTLTWGMVYFANRVQLLVLYSDLDPQEAQSITTKLQTMQVEYELSDDGRTIRIASDKLAQVRIQLASEGLPESGRVGFEIFDRTNFGLTNFQEQVNYQRAMEGELARSIMTLNQVEAARVHLVLPKDSLYTSPEDQTKASVILKLKNGQTLPESSVQGIVNIVASSVKGLTPEKIAVIDYRGKILSRSDAENSLTGQQLDVRQKMESEMAAKIVQILEPAVGPGRVRPQVSIAMNFEQVDETVEQYDPQASVIRSEQRQIENDPKSTPVGGPVGGLVTLRPSVPPAAPAATPSPAAGAAPPAAATAAAAAKPSPLRQNETINYEVSKAIRHIVNPVPKVERVSVAVIIDSQSENTTGPDGAAKTTVVPRKPEEMKKYKDLVSAAIAFNPERGDQLIVENISFDNELETFASPSFLEKQVPNILTGLRYVIIPVLFLLVYILFIRPVQKTVLGNWQPVAVEAGGRSFSRGNAIQTPITVKQLEARIQSSGGSMSEDLDGGERDLLPMPGQSRTDLIRKRVVEQAKQDPETVARLVRLWLNEDKNK